jgi:hypothetical protein
VNTLMNLRVPQNAGKSRYSQISRVGTNMWRIVTVPMHLCEILSGCAYELDSASHCAAR